MAMQASAPVEIQIVSDLHLEVDKEYATFKIPKSAPCLALIGNIGNVSDAGLFDFLRRMCEQHEVVLFVPGNYEAYNGSWPKVDAKLKEFQKTINDSEEDGLGKFVYMNQTAYNIPDTNITVLGCTLFSNIDMDHCGAIYMETDDFDLTEGWRLDDYHQSYTDDLEWLNDMVKEISEKKDGFHKIVILTHYCPTLEAIPRGNKNSPLVSAFVTDLTNELCWKSENVKVWAWGRTNYNWDAIDEATGKRLLSNQRGDPLFEVRKWDPSKTLYI